MLSVKKIFLLLIILLLISTLINNKYFGSLSMAAYYFYVISGTALMLFTAIVYFTHSSTIKIANSIPIILLTVLTSYYFIQSQFSSYYGINMMHIFLLVNCLLLISFSIVFKLIDVNPGQIYKIITVLASLVSILCLLQSIGWVNGPTKLFKVSGTWVNPNVTAMFLAMAAPAVLSLYFTKGSKHRNLYVVAIVLITIALLLLRSRTALIGLSITTLILIQSKYQVVQVLRNRYKGIKIALPLLLSIVIIISLGVYLYYLKQASAEGRKLIWKISADLVAQKPLMGHGYGQFEHDYNLEQASYFSLEAPSSTEIENAGYVSMAYNEFLQNLVEGGIIALILFVLFFLSLIIPFPLKSDIQIVSAHAAIISFIAMSVFNFTIQAIPAMSLFIIYAALISIHVTSNFGPRSILRKAPVCFLLLSIAIYLEFSQVKLANASAENSYALSLIVDGKSDLAVQRLDPLRNILARSEPYWTNYGMALFKQKKYAQALEKFKRAALLKPYPETYLKIAACYQKLGKVDSAISEYTLAKNIVPNRMRPVFSLMTIYADQKDSQNANAMAKQIIAMTPKVTSKETDYYKRIASGILKNLIQYNGSQ